MSTKIYTVIISLLLITFTYSQYSYKPLTRTEKNLFKKTCKDLIVSFDNKEYSTFEMFTTKALTEYVNILLDPGCVILRKDYNQLDSLLKYSKSNQFINNEKSKIVSDSRVCYIDKAITLFTTQKVKDSITLYKKMLNTVCDSILNGEISLNTYREIYNTKNVSIEIKNQARTMVENLFQSTFLDLSASLDYDSLLNFSKMYPDIYTEDLLQMKEKSRQKSRLSLIRKPNWEKLDKYTSLFGSDTQCVNATKNYYRTFLMKNIDPKLFEMFRLRFPEDDYILSSSFEDRLYTRIVTDKLDEDVASYFKFFPQGKYAAMLVSGLQIHQQVQGEVQ